MKTNLKKENTEKDLLYILGKQRVRFKYMDNLCEIVKYNIKFDSHAVAIDAFNYGVMIGRRLERMKKNETSKNEVE